LLDARSIRLEALDDLAVDHERRRGAALPRVDQLIARPRIGLDVLRFVGDAVLPKELLGGAAVPSARLVIENYTRHHAALLLDFALGLLRSGPGPNGLQGVAPCCPSFTPLEAAIYDKRGPSPSAIVGCARTASRNVEYGSPASITACTVATTSPASGPIIVKPRIRS
jgi:hypothetical protein